MNDHTSQIDRCPVCQHQAPHRGTCGALIALGGAEAICGCDGREYGLAARLMLIERNIADLAHAGQRNARAGLLNVWLFVHQHCCDGFGDG